MNWLKAYLQQEREKIRELSGGAKAAYIWEYYKLWIIGIGSFLILTIWLAFRILTNIPDNWMFLCIVDTRARMGTETEFWQGYVDYTGYDLKQKKVEFNSDNYFNYAQDYGRGNDYYDAFIAYIDSGRLDAAIMTVDSLTKFGESGRLLDLNREECKNLMEKYGDRILYAIPYDTEYSEDPVPIGIDISDSIVMTKYRAYEKDCAIGISAFSQNIEAVEKFMDYIYEEE